jgi:hypothetical protein
MMPTDAVTSITSVVAAPISNMALPRGHLSCQQLKSISGKARKATGLDRDSIGSSYSSCRLGCHMVERCEDFLLPEIRHQFTNVA